MHVETFLLDLMASENTEELVLPEELLNRLLSEVVRTIALWVLFEVSVDGFFVFHRVCPHQVAENTVERDLLLSVDLVNLV